MWRCYNIMLLTCQVTAKNKLLLQEFPYWSKMFLFFFSPISVPISKLNIRKTENGIFKINVFFECKTFVDQCIYSKIYVMYFYPASQTNYTAFFFSPQWLYFYLPHFLRLSYSHFLLNYYYHYFLKNYK